MNSSIHEEPGEDMNVRLVHAALWRETAEPSERKRGLPWYLRRLYAIMFILAVIYLMLQVFDWREYEDNARVRMQRDQQRQKAWQDQHQPQPAVAYGGRS